MEGRSNAPHQPCLSHLGINIDSIEILLDILNLKILLQFPRQPQVTAYQGECRSIGVGYFKTKKNTTKNNDKYMSLQLQNKETTNLIDALFLHNN